MLRGAPVIAALCREYLSHLGEIKKVMPAQTLREQESENAKRIKTEKLIFLRNKMRSLHVKTTDLSERDMKILTKKIGKYGFIAEEIKAEFERTF